MLGMSDGTRRHIGQGPPRGYHVRPRTDAAHKWSEDLNPKSARLLVSRRREFTTAARHRLRMVLAMMTSLTPGSRALVLESRHVVILNFYHELDRTHTHPGRLELAPHCRRHTGSCGRRIGVRPNRTRPSARHPPRAKPSSRRTSEQRGPSAERAGRRLTSACAEHNRGDHDLDQRVHATFTPSGYSMSHVPPPCTFAMRPG